MDPTAPLAIIGRKERVDFPDWGLCRLRAKIDTGAYSAALDVAGYELVEGEGGLVARVRLNLPHRPEGHALVEAPVVRTVFVVNPGGRRERRPVVETTMKLGPHTRPVRLTLTDRAGMRHRLILGRQVLAGLFLVDVSQKYLLRTCAGES